MENLRFGNILIIKIMNPYIRKIVELHKIHEAIESKSNNEGGGNAVNKDYYDFNDKNDVLELSKIIVKSSGKQLSAPNEAIESMIKNLTIADNPTESVINYIRYDDITNINKDSGGNNIGTINTNGVNFVGCSILFSDSSGIYVIPSSIEVM